MIQYQMETIMTYIDDEDFVYYPYLDYGMESVLMVANLDLSSYL